MATPHDLVTGQKTVATGTATAITSETMDSRRGVLIKALAANDQPVYVGLTGVTVLTGFELSAKESVVIPHLKASEIFAITTGTCKVSFIIV
jgi:hypothetical protein